MGADINLATQMQKIGGLLAHAEAAQAMVAKGLAAQAENDALVKQLINRNAEILKHLQVEIDQIGARAQQAAAGTVHIEVQKSLQGAGAVVRTAASEALRPVMEEAQERIRQAQKAEWSLSQKAERFSNRVLAIMAVSALGALMVVPLGVSAELAWRRSAIASLVQEGSDISGQITKMQAVSQQLKAKGLNIDFQTCKGPKGHAHRCVAVKPFSPQWGTDQAPYRVLKGY